MPDETDNKDFVAKALDTTIRIGLVLLLAIWCFQIVAPFLRPIVWGVIIAIGSYPAYRSLEVRLKGRSGVAAVVFTLVFLVVLIVPAVMLSAATVDSVKVLAADVADGTLTIPAPPEGVAKWPFIGAKVSEVWSLAAENLSAVLTR